MTRATVAVVGGGITGLAAAHELAHGDDPPHVVVYEADTRLGGKLRTESFAGLAVETGPDAVLARVPYAIDLCRRLGLGDELVAPSTGRAFVWARGRLRPLPEGLVLGVPGRLGPVARSGIVSPLGLARAGLDLVLPRSPAGDVSVVEGIGRRLGWQVAERLVDPLVSGINAGRGDRLSLGAAAPDVAAVAASNRSLLLGLRRRPPAPTGAGHPVFLTVAGGLSRLVDRLAGDLRDAGVELHTAHRLDRLPDADAVVVTTPAFTAADLVAPVSPDAAMELASIDHASVAIVTLAYPEAALDGPLDGSGFLVPRNTGWLMTASTWLSSKWAHLRPPGLVLVRCSAGRAGDDRFTTMDDTELVGRLHGELVRAVGVTEAPVEWRVDRWPRAFPQYDVGHLDRVARIEAALAADAPGITVTGAAFRGVGIASCVRQGREAAARVRLRHGRDPSSADR